MGASWDVLKEDKEILIFPLISVVCCLLVMASFAVPMFLADAWLPPGKEATTADAVEYYAILFLFYFCIYFIIIFFNSAMIACAVIRMEGGDPTVGDGFRAAFSRIALIAGWALVSATVGVVLRAIEDRSKWVGKIVAGLLGIAWGVVSFLVVPILVVEKKGPITAVKESAALLKKTWGEQIIGNFSFGLVFFLLSMPAFVVIFLGGALAFRLTASPAAFIPFVGLGVLYIVLLALIQSALQAVFQAAVYLYARDGRTPPGFDSRLLMDSMVQK